jgi:hypothetical protein
MEGVPGSNPGASTRHTAENAAHFESLFFFAPARAFRTCSLLRKKAVQSAWFWAVCPMRLGAEQIFAPIVVKSLKIFGTNLVQNGLTL